MDNGTTFSQKHELVTGQINGGRIDRPMWAGEAFYHPGDDYFQIRLAIFPFSYYLTRNKDSDTAYTVWAQKVKDVSPSLFRRPVGRAVIADALKTHLEIQIPLLGLRTNPLLCLFPSSNSTYHANKQTEVKSEQE